jgi:hypothetical protein
MNGSLLDEMKSQAENMIEMRLRQWMDYYYEKELKPSLIAEIKKEVNITAYERLGKIGFEVEYSKNKE